MPSPEDTARQMWRLLEPIHAVIYFPPEGHPLFTALGLKGFWMSYFAWRSAPLGAVGPEVAEAMFFVFHPTLVSRALPDAWAFSTPEQVLTTRAELADQRLRAALGELAVSHDVRTAARLAVPIAQGSPRAGRPLGAAHAAVALPDDGDPLAQLWWAATVLREHRFDGHVAALVSAGVGGCESLVLAGASGAAGPEGGRLLQGSRRWPDDEWAAAVAGLADRGWLDESGGFTPEGRAAHAAVEATTDRSAAVAYASWSEDDLDTLAAALRPLTDRIATSGALPYPNPIGIDPRLG